MAIPNSHILTFSSQPSSCEMSTPALAICATISCLSVGGMVVVESPRVVVKFWEGFYFIYFAFSHNLFSILLIRWQMMKWCSELCLRNERWYDHICTYKIFVIALLYDTWLYLFGDVISAPRIYHVNASKNRSVVPIDVSMKATFGHLLELQPPRIITESLLNSTVYPSRSSDSIFNV